MANKVIYIREKKELDELFNTEEELLDKVTPYCEATGKKLETEFYYDIIHKLWKLQLTISE